MLGTLAFMTDVLTPPQMWRWRLAIFAIFTSSGLSIATWASRVPAIKTSLGVDNVEVGLMLLGAGIASVVGLSSGQVILARFGARRGRAGGNGFENWRAMSSSYRRDAVQARGELHVDGLDRLRLRPQGDRPRVQLGRAQEQAPVFRFRHGAGGQARGDASGAMLEPSRASAHATSTSGRTGGEQVSSSTREVEHVTHKVRVAGYVFCDRHVVIVPARSNDATRGVSAS